MKPIIAIVATCLCYVASNTYAATSTSSSSSSVSASGSYSYNATTNASSSGTATQGFTLAPGGTVYSHAYPRADSGYSNNRRSGYSHFNNNRSYRRSSNFYSSYYYPSSLSGHSRGSYQHYHRSYNVYQHR
jgi:hypothetical protein